MVEQDGRLETHDNEKCSTEEMQLPYVWRGEGY